MHHLRVEAPLTPPPAGRRLRHAVAHARHLARRFAGSLRPRPVPADDLAWVRQVLTAPEHTAWERMDPADRAESVMVARRVEGALAATPHAADHRWIAAALVHDAGKAGTLRSPWARAGVTVLGWFVPARRLPGRAGHYLDHAARGRASLAAGGARPEVAAWAGAHHAPARWPAAIPREVCEALAAADGEAITTCAAL